MPGDVNMIDANGKAYAIPEEQVAGALASGFHMESGDEGTARVTQQAREDEYGGIGGKVQAFSAGALRGLTLGGSDIALRGLYGDMGRDQLKALEDVNPGTSIAGNVAGALAPALLTGGASAEAGIGARILGSTPSALVGKAGAAITRLGEGGGAIARTAAAAAGGAAEGAAYGAGGYLSQIALEDKPLSADAFVGAMGHGAMWGGALAGGLSVAESTLLRAKSLFPQREVTRQAADAMEREATSTIRQSIDDGATMQQTAQDELRAMRLADAKVRLDSSKQLADIKIAEAQARLERQQALAERAKAGPKGRTRKVFDDAPEAAAGESAVQPPTTESAPFATQAPQSPTLLDQLGATKAGLDEGQSLGALSSRGGPVAVEDAANEAIAASSPDAAKLVDAAKRERMTRDEIQNWIKGRRAAGDQNAAERGYRVSYESSLTGARAPAGLGMKLDRLSTFGEETEASLANQARTVAKVRPEERLAANDAIGRMFGRPSIGEEIVNGVEAKPSLDDAIAGALRKHNGEHVDLSEDIAKAAKIIGDHEQASADLAEALGAKAPAGASERAQQYRQATAAKAESDAAASASTADSLTNKLAPEVARSTGKAIDGGMMQKLGDLGAGLELLKHMGVPVPDVSAIPVIGPVLSFYLKARAAMGIIGRKGGSVPKTAESTIAAKAAATRNRVNAAVSKLLDVGAGATRAAQKAAGPAAGLAYKLFPSPGDKQTKEPSDGDAQAAYRRRMDELARASQPDAVMQAVRDRVHTSDPALQQEIAATMARKLSFLAGKAPRETMLPTLLKGDGKWQPSKTQLEVFSRYIQAAEDPAKVLEDVAHGAPVTVEAAETLRKVYPSLYHEAQTVLLERARDLETKLPYSRRVSLSILFQVPVDGTMSPQHIAWLQQGTSAALSAAQGTPAGAPPTPGISGSVALGDRAMTALDRRAGA